jgi:cell division protease FtsH
VHKVTILPRGGAAGVTWSLPKDDRRGDRVNNIKDYMAQAMGGRVAEEIVYKPGQVTAGAGNDLIKVTGLAKRFVTEFGMSPKLKNLSFREERGLFEDSETRISYSQKTAEIIDSEIQLLVNEATQRATKVINANRKFLDKLKDELLKKETLEEAEINEILKDAKAPKEVLLN